MAVTLSGSGGVFTRLGAIGQLLNDVNAFSGSALTIDGRATDISATVVTRFNTLETTFAAGTALYSAIDGAQQQLSNYQGVQSGLKSYLRSLAQTLLITQVNADTPLKQKTVLAAATELIRQMVGTSDSVKANVPALGSQTSVGSPTGNPGVVSTIKTGKGTYSGQEYAVAETIYFTCTRDSQSGGATANQEGFTVAGQNPQTDTLAYDWPKGSGASQSMSVIDPTQNNSGGTVLVNGSFETWTTAAQPPDNWNVLVGTRDTDYAKETSTVFASSAGALKFIGGTAAVTSFAQTFNTTPTTTAGSGGTGYNLALYPETLFAVSFWIKADVVPAAGVITVDLVDGSSAVIADTAGTNNTTAITLSGISTSYVQKSAVFRLPAAAPTTIKLRIRASTAISAGTNIYVDDLALAKMVPLYASGPAFSIFRGSTKPLAGDQWTEALTISASGALQRLAQKLWAIDQLGLYLPSLANGSQTVADTLIV